MITPAHHDEIIVFYLMKVSFVRVQRNKIRSERRKGTLFTRRKVINVAATSSCCRRHIIFLLTVFTGGAVDNAI
jgi:hypothetical protein